MLHHLHLLFRQRDKNKPISPWNCPESTFSLSFELYPLWLMNKRWRMIQNNSILLIEMPFFCSAWTNGKVVECERFECGTSRSINITILSGNVLRKLIEGCCTKAQRKIKDATSSCISSFICSLHIFFGCCFNHMELVLLFFCSFSVRLLVFVILLKQNKNFYSDNFILYLKTQAISYHISVKSRMREIFSDKALTYFLFGFCCFTFFFSGHICWNFHSMLAYFYNYAI